MPQLEWYMNDVIRDQIIFGIRPVGGTEIDDAVILSADQSRRMSDELCHALAESDAGKDLSYPERSQKILRSYYQRAAYTADCEYDEATDMLCVSFRDHSNTVGRRWYPTASISSIGMDIAHWTAKRVLYRGEEGTISEGRAAVRDQAHVSTIPVAA